MAFHPAIHQRELLAGESVVLSAACQSCGDTLTMQWALPNAAELRARAEIATQLPIAAGAEPHGHEHHVREPHVREPHALRAAPEQDDAPTPPSRLGSWRIAEAQAERAPAAPTPPTPEDDPRMAEFLTQFTERIDRARHNLSRVHEDLPQAILGDGDSLRRPMLARRPSIDEIPRELASTPVAFAAETPLIQQPSFAAQPAPAPAPEPVLEQPMPTQTVAVPEPTFAQPMPAQPVAAPEPAFAEPMPMPAPARAAVPEPVAPAPAPAVAAAPEPVAPAEPNFAALALDAPLPVAIAHAVTEQQAAGPAMGIAPTDADVFPPAVVQHQPVVAGGPALADAAADVWATASAEPAAATPVASSAPHTPFAAALSASASASAAAAPPLAMPGPMPSAPSFAAPAATAAMPAPAPAAPAPAFAPSFAPPAPETAGHGVAEQPTASMPAVHTPVAQPTGDQPSAPAQPVAHDAHVAMPHPQPGTEVVSPSPEHAGAASIEAAFEPERGFDWGPEAEMGTEPKRRGRLTRRGRGSTQEDALSLPGVSSFAVSTDVDAALDAAPRRSKLGAIEVFAVVVLAAIAGLAGVKVVTSDTPEAAASSTPAVTQPAAITPPISSKPPSPTTPAAKAAAAKAKAAKLKAVKPKAAAAKSKTGTPVASSADADAASTPVATDATPTTQVQTAPADTAAMTAADAPASNPAARP